MVLRPSTYHQSPSRSDTTRGRRSSPSAQRVQRSGGSMMWESEEMIQGRSKESAGGCARCAVMLILLVNESGPFRRCLHVVFSVVFRRCRVAVPASAGIPVACPRVEWLPR